ncbi:hypothetical protein CEO44_28860 [Klebsiella pneumoniae]|nr:hypothetical protein CEO56_28900 [Klebsiella pneumoniae]OZM33180.1 hypothetical protein CEO46_28885 [Klebsiella pneumoniae]OZM44476.1 hypothetical protein CEO44_28860 [Klebsiella pneumoniae]OZM58953.1 hypothetical protein CEO42_28030 [Klebsiella pneumoniae]
MFAGKKSAQIREILISESAWEEMTCLFAPSLIVLPVFRHQYSFATKPFFLHCCLDCFGFFQWVKSHGFYK